VSALRPVEQLDADARRLLRPAELLERYPGLKARTLEYWIKRAATRRVVLNGRERVLEGNGLEPAILRKGRMVWIRTELFLRWWLEGDIETPLPPGRAEAFERKPLPSRAEG
jgi:hypothetical protein